MAEILDPPLYAEPAPAAPATPKGSRHAAALGGGAVNGLGDLHGLEHLGQHYARSLRGLFEPLLKRQPKISAEPHHILKFDDYLDARGSGLCSVTVVGIAPLNGKAMIVLDGALVLEMVDLFFGGTGVAPSPLPHEFTPTAEAMSARVVAGLCERLGAAWSELAEIEFKPGRSECNPGMLSHIDGDDRVVLTRFVLALSETRRVPVDILYPASALKPLAATLSSKVQGKRGEVDPAWLGGLTRAVMNVKLPVRSVLAEPVIPLAQLMALKPGDIIPISFGPEIPLLVADNRFARGSVGAANGRAAIRVNRIEPFEDEDQQ